MIDGEVQFHGVHLCNLGLELGEDSLLPDGGHDEVVDEGFELVLGDAFFQDELVVFHYCVHMELHVEFLHVLVLFEPQTAGEVLDVELHYLADYLPDFFLVQDVPDCVHLYFKYYPKTNFPVQGLLLLFFSGYFVGGAGGYKRSDSLSYSNT